MANFFERSNPMRWNNFRTLAGALLLLAGAALFLDRYLQTGWLSLAILPVIALYLYAWGMRLRHMGLIVFGAALGGLGVGLAAALQPPGLALLDRLGMLLFYNGLSWLLAALSVLARSHLRAWWALVPAGALGGIGAGLLFSNLAWGALFLYVGIAVGVALLAWGLLDKLIGLVIAGCIVATVAAGVALAWGVPAERGALAQTGLMLVVFAFGWGLITLGGRIVLRRFLWWPLIPGGILAVVGYGLYISGDPNNALGFIGNTGSIGLMIFGMYLLLMRKGIHRD